MKLEAQPAHRFSNSVCAKIVESLYRLPWTIATTKTEAARGGKGFAYTCGQARSSATEIVQTQNSTTIPTEGRIGNIV